MMSPRRFGAVGRRLGAVVRRPVRMRRTASLTIGIGGAIVLCLVVAVVAASLFPVVTGSPATGADDAAPSEPLPTLPSAPSSDSAGDAQAQWLARTFLDQWVDDGRVVRRDEGGDTVSEGQAYAMLLAVVADDEGGFDSVWEWTRTHLMRDDGLLAWAWADGEVTDSTSASDAEVDAARALILAGERFDRPDLSAAGAALATAVMEELTEVTPLGRVLLPGQWAAGQSDTPYNPSYASPAAFAVFADETGDRRWSDVARTSGVVLDELLERDGLPPDWALIRADGSVVASDGPAGAGPDAQFGYDAPRIAIRYAESCDADDRDRAAAAAAALTRWNEPPAPLGLDAEPIGAERSPLNLVAAAASAAAEGGDADAERYLDDAVSMTRDIPTYYGRAWTALGTSMLTSELLGACPPLAESAD